MQDLISFLHTNVRSKKEDTACEVLAYLLRQDFGQSFLNSLLEITEATRLDVVTRRAISSISGIPDILILEGDSVAAIFELKLYAGLTRAQLESYSKACKNLFFIVPKERSRKFSSLLSAISPIPSVWSWEDLLDKLYPADNNDVTREETLYKSAVFHLREFCGVMETKRFEPFSVKQLQVFSSDLNAMHFVWLTQRLLELGKSKNIIQDAGRVGAGFDEYFYYGQNVMMGSRKIWIGFWPLAWQKAPTSGPLWIWLNISPSGLKGNGFRDVLEIQGNIALPLFSFNSQALTQEDEVQLLLNSLEVVAERIRGL